MTGRPHYPQGRASEPTTSQLGGPDYNLIAHLCSIRKDGDEAMWAVEEYV